jgi:hemerythrin-like domain-containing protein
VTEGEKTRLVAWSMEMRHVHERLRQALRATREGFYNDRGRAEPAMGDLLLFCQGFCTALTSHHQGEDRTLFPAIVAAHPQLRETVRILEQDHAMIAQLLSELHDAVEQAANPAELEQQLTGIAAIMESHFRYEERQLLRELERLELDEDP